MAASRRRLRGHVAAALVAASAAAAASSIAAFARLPSAAARPPALAGAPSFRGVDGRQGPGVATGAPDARGSGSAAAVSAACVAVAAALARRRRRGARQPGLDAAQRRGEEARTARLSLPEAGAAGGRALHGLNDLLNRGLGSVLLVVAAGGSMWLANAPRTAAPWLALWDTALGPAIGAHALSYRGWVNEGLMSLFFFYVGLEIKKEMVEGSLASPRKAMLPCVAALGGMVVPMLVYAAVNRWAPGGSMAGVTIPMATDIAFAMGVFGFFRRRMPAVAEPFLLTLATVDDLGAILVIAACFAGNLAPRFLMGAAAALVAASHLGRHTVKRSSRGIAIPGVALWYCLLRGGLNADIAGFLAALCVPMRGKDGREVVERLIERWAPVCGLLILPLFALANCAVPLGGVGDALAGGGWGVPAGVGLGLLLGKPVGILSFSLLAARTGLASMPPGLGKRHVAICGLLGSIGFTMCLFLIENSLSGRVAEITKVAMLLASLTGAVVSALLMRMQPRLPAGPEKANKADGAALAP